MLVHQAPSHLAPSQLSRNECVRVSSKFTGLQDPSILALDEVTFIDFFEF